MKLSRTIRATAVTVAFLGANGTAFAAATSIDDLVPRDLPITLPGSYLAARGADFDRAFSDAISYYANAFNNALASCRSAVSKPSVNQP